ncbi:nucleoside kinase [Phocaeicola oris]|uniref:nucleoside kinase n=1 Tax=Phocaeicola oris TaxID=2896850 RepID=UPI00234E38AD|nr:nucleoside kinase [Phocaeicola oris]MCE2616260.1 nucleoside kinase [Phocaeicola oris]
MEHMLQICCKNNNISKEFPIGSSLLEIYNGFNLAMPYGVVSAKVNNVVEGLNFRVYNNKDVEFLDVTSASAMRTYVRSLCFVMCKAVEDLYPNGDFIMEHPVSKGYYICLTIGREIGLDDVMRLKQRMQEIIDQDIPFHRFEAHTSDVAELFKMKGREDKVRLVNSTGKLYSHYYTLGECVDYYYGCLLPSTGFIKKWDLVKYYDGVLLRVPKQSNPNELEDIVKQDKMLEVFKETRRWNRIIGVSNVGDFNLVASKGFTSDMIKVSEALQEKKISNIADEIYRRNQGEHHVRIVLISGPSSSGKTTFSKRLSVQLMANGLRPYPVSLDNYFLDREHTPKDENGDYDFESLYALDLDYFNQQLQDLLTGKEVMLPKFNFTTGKRESDKKLKLDENMILILEGIHALNPELASHIPDEEKYRIYVSALTTIQLDDHNNIPTTDNRLLRRIVRDYKYRNYSAEETICRWPSVRRGEDKWIFPYQENADAMFNSALLFELAVIKDVAEPILRKVPEDCPEYSEAYRLSKFLSYIKSIPSREIPPTSLLREFLGGSSFKY